jgi:hypothetical protein
MSLAHLEVGKKKDSWCFWGHYQHRFYTVCPVPTFLSLALSSTGTEQLPKQTSHSVKKEIFPWIRI